MLRTHVKLGNEGCLVIKRDIAAYAYVKSTEQEELRWSAVVGAARKLHSLLCVRGLI